MWPPQGSIRNNDDKSLLLAASPPEHRGKKKKLLQRSCVKVWYRIDPSDPRHWKSNIWGRDLYWASHANHTLALHMQPVLKSSVAVFNQFFLPNASTTQPPPDWFQAWQISIYSFDRFLSCPQQEQHMSISNKDAFEKKKKWVGFILKEWPPHKQPKYMRMSSDKKYQAKSSVLDTVLGLFEDREHSAHSNALQHYMNLKSTRGFKHILIRTSVISGWTNFFLY